MSTQEVPQHIEDPLAGDVDRFVPPDETRTKRQIAQAAQYALEAYGNDASDAYWEEYDDLHAEHEEPVAEEKYDFTEKDLEDRKKATSWLEAAAESYEKQAEKFGRVKGDDAKKGVSAFAQVTAPRLSDEEVVESKALNRVLENGFYATSDDNVYSALNTIQTGNLRRAGWFSKWPDGSYKAAMDIENSELDLDGLREFTDKFANLQRQRDAVIAEGGTDPLADQMQETFSTVGEKP